MPSRSRNSRALLIVVTALLHSPAPAQQPAIRYAMSPALLASALTDRIPAITADRVHLPLPITSAVPQPSLRVAAAELRPDASLLLRMLCRSPAECLPFMAVVSMPDRAEALTALSTLRGTSAALVASQRTSAVAVGSRVTLELCDRQMHIQLQGIAVDTGAAGAEIRVASLDRRHIYHGVVVDTGIVRGDLQ